ncbi:hypothetical protein AAVH_27810 [Aphelenchoides avenae]|nr:hypothetical protein AAVH_27810 [Aphelenchus avenae]
MKQYWRCREYQTCAVRGVSDFGSVVITRTRPGLEHTHEQSPAMQAPPIFIFASATGIQSLREARDWGSDGTLYIAPPQFGQLYTVHALRDDHSAICAAYMLLPNRTTATYLRALRALIREAHLEDAAPTSIMTDFEAAAITAWRALYPAARMRGCLFHYSQALWRNIASKGLTLLYRGNGRARELLRCFGAMAFVHPNDVSQAFDEIVAALRACIANGEIDANFDEAVQGFCDYVRDNYVRRRDRQGRWQAPRVANIGQWNCHFEALQGFHRTNNTIEAWNRQFGEMFPKAHCALDKFIYRMQTDEDRSRQALQRVMLFPNEPLRRGRRPQHIATDAALRNLVEQYDEYVGGGRLIDFMRTVQYHLCKAKFPGEAPAEGDGENVDAEHAGQGDLDEQPPRNAQILAPALPDLSLTMLWLLHLAALKLWHLHMAVLKLRHLHLAVLKLRHLHLAVLKLLLLHVAVLKLLHLVVSVLRLSSPSLVLKLLHLLLAELKLSTPSL